MCESQRPPCKRSLVDKQESLSGDSQRPPSQMTLNFSQQEKAGEKQPDGHSASMRTTEEVAISGMLEAMGDHEFYCASYSSKDEPHVNGLLMTLAIGQRYKEQDIAAAREAGENIDDLKAASKILHRLA